MNFVGTVEATTVTFFDNDFSMSMIMTDIFDGDFY